MVYTIKKAKLIRCNRRQMSQELRKGFTNAVTCLQNLPPQRMTADEASTYPGVKSRYDECVELFQVLFGFCSLIATRYVATHINYTLNIHDTADFLAWHRGYIHYLEQDLQNLCDYQGKLPYWEWSLDAEAPQNSELFNGDEYSMGSNGQYIPDRTPVYLGLQQVTLPLGTGGGCVTGGPFANYTVNMGPVAAPNLTALDYQFGYNPRCLSRDLSPGLTQQYLTWTNVTTLILENTLVEEFQGVMQADSTYSAADNKFGVHGCGHYAVGSIMADFYASPADPIFFLHHAQVDRMWSIWENIDPYRRLTAIHGTSTMLNDPPSAEMSLTDIMPYGLVADDIAFSEMMDTFAGPLCYYYQ